MEGDLRLGLVLYGLIFIVMNIVMLVCVIVRRYQLKVASGYSDDKALNQLVRMHGNFIEHAPLMLVLLLIAQQMNLPTKLFHSYGVLCVLGRLFHAYSMGYRELQEPFTIRFRQVGMMLTFAAYMLMAGYFIYFLQTSLV